MSFSLSSEQQMLRDSIDKFLQQNYDFETRRSLASSPLGYSSENWQTFADLGWLSIPFSEESGGYGGSIVDVITVTEAFGKVLATEPYVANLILAGRLLEIIASEDQKQLILPSLIAGETQLALAHSERASAANPAYVGCQLDTDGDGYRINGDKIVVLNGPSADLLLVSARSSGKARDRTGIEIFLVDANSEGITRRDYSTIDGLRAADINFNNVRIPATARLGNPDTNIQALETVIDEAIVAMSAEAVGAMEILNTQTVEYARTRKQFGTPIGKFQSLAFRMVDMFIAQEQSKSMLYMGALSLAEGKAETSQAVSALKVQISKASQLIGEQSVQIHGGMGTTDELAIGHYFKRLLAIDALFGNRDYHLDRYVNTASLSRISG